MRLCVFVVVVACHFDPGVVPDPDGTMPIDMMGSGSDAKLPIDGSTCNATGLTCTGGTTKAMMCNGACWASCEDNQAVTQTAASAACTSWGGKLAPLRDANDATCVEMLLPGDQSWIGLEQSASAPNPNAGWTWNSDNVSITYTNWGLNQPDDSNGSENNQEQCAMRNSVGEWHDVPCDNVLLMFSCRHN